MAWISIFDIKFDWPGASTVKTKTILTPFLTATCAFIAGAIDCTQQLSDCLNDPNNTLQYCENQQESCEAHSGGWWATIDEHIMIRRSSPCKALDSLEQEHQQNATTKVQVFITMRSS